MNKLCSKCGATKCLTEFRERKKGTGQYASWCRVCANEAAKLNMRERLKDPRAHEQRGRGQPVGTHW